MSSESGKDAKGWSSLSAQGQIAANFAGFCGSCDIVWPKDIDTFRQALEILTDKPPCSDNLKEE